ncbi:MAG TPA: radical SAM protein, partial [Acidobacteriaceae bacterium]|nr:radical SAM protein [Acidobacteriaceae bacterium]
MSNAEARRYMEASCPRVPQVHLIETARGGNLFVADGSRLFAAGLSLYSRFESAIHEGNSTEISALLDKVGLGESPLIDDEPLSNPAIHALSLAIAQKCNLGCTYCYAQQGEFGGAGKNMALAEATRAVDLLVNGADEGARLNLAFLGGEPLVNRAVLQAATLYAAELAERRGNPITFSITTNGTLLTEADAEFFEAHAFAVTISLDGPRETHNLLRPFKSGNGSFDAILQRIRPLLALQRRMQVSARVTVTPANLELRRTLDEFIDLGFHSVGFSPMLSSPSGNGEMQGENLETMLGEMIDCGREFERRTVKGERYPFANMTNAMREIQRGTHRPYPCGAGA